MRQIIDLTEEQKIAKHYSAMLDSVFMINDAIANPAKYTNDEAVIQRNVDHLELMLAKDFWTTEDMASVNAAIAAGKA
jgi:hypothetical protein